ncbi:MAG TPA: c-type cytochrome domain-containing protein [Planctomycetaceae bacterium]|nr:c-type cytochrome domain-containing protein [Planctomycetaceae bacterium]
MLRCTPFVFVAVITSSTFAADTPDFVALQPIFRGSCNGCHNAKEAEGGLVLEDFARAMKGGDSGASIVAGDSAKSELWKRLTATDDTVMPPKDQARLKPTELALIKAWIDGGAKPPAGGLAATGLVTPKVALQAKVRSPVTAIAVDPLGRFLAIARPDVVEIVAASDRKAVTQLVGHTGAIADVQFSTAGDRLVVAAGESGLSGEATLWNPADWSRGLVVTGHQDALYSASLSPDETILATASYDRDIRTWDAKTGAALKTLSGHNDAVYSLAFHPNGKILASASGDRTIKLWDVAQGQRLDTFAQPSKEQYHVQFSPSGKVVAAGGVDMRVRVWQISETGKEGTNPIAYARFAHEAPILRTVFSPDGGLLASASEDRRIKLWETRTFTQVAMLERQTDWPSAVAFSHDSKQLFVGRMNGEFAAYPVDPAWADRTNDLEALPDSPAITKTDAAPMPAEIAEAEPNDDAAQAQPLTLPAVVKATLNSTTGRDADLYRFEAKAGQSWIIETNAARSGSKADTKLEVLDTNGQPVPRALLQAVRDSYVNFRPIDSSQLEVRLEYWEEMDLNQLLYMNGEICKLFRAPRGPDSGFELYQNAGKRRNYFDTSATGQAKEQPVYIVEAYPPGAPIVDNGLPVFPVFYTNDDDAERELGTDSRLTFTAPADGTYLVRVTDSRGFVSDKHTYQLTVRPPQPGFHVTVETMNVKIPAGSGQRLKFNVDRIDNFDGAIRISVDNLPAGYHVAQPTVIAAGQLNTFSVITAAADAQPADKDTWAKVVVTAAADIAGQTVSKPAGNLGTITLEKPASIRITLVPDDLATTSTDGGVVITPGTTITAKIRVERNGFDGDVKLDIDNLPHGIIVDNIGLSGVLVRANETERQIFLTARPWIGETTRWIHAVAQTQGNQASAAIPLHVRSNASVASTPGR